ncbi:hypothetical protein [Candidatus Palauibacter sp.]|uniref:hypothetical protein n=1 Tax=Candidatus Palauibacter sp. TaxID=3101350 RepID=UPI003B021A30
MTTNRLGRFANRAILGVLAAACPALAGHAAAQLIQIRTVPVATGDQFLTTPSANFGMAGLTYAVDDSIADGWSNPAKGALLSESSLLSAPVYYWISDASGRGFTLPVGGLIAGEAWFGGVTTALQEIDNASDGGFGPGRAGRLSDMSRRNLYAGGFVGRRLGSGTWSLGLGASTARLQAMDGVDLLYAGADRIVQSGSIDDVRLGVYRDAGRDRASAVVVRNSISMMHDVTYVERTSTRTDRNLDQTRTWGLQLAWDRHLRAPGWRIGASLTANRKSHPKIPNYNIQNIPRDPGNSTAWELGFGVARSMDGTTAGLDVAVQPIRSDTWQEAEDPVETTDGTTIPAGGRTIENDFSFFNLRLRVGMAHEFETLGVRLGLEGRSYGYTLEQTNHVEAEFRTQNESWIEWTPAAAVIFRLGAADLHYGVRLTTGTGRPVTNPNQPDRATSGGEFVIAPDGPLGLVDTGVLTHQFWVRIPVR